MSEEIIAAAGLVLGALIAGIVNGYAARVKARELAMAYEQRLRDDYLANARSYTRTLYVPLHRALSRLEDAYERFRPVIQTSREGAPEEACEKFVGACSNFVTETEQLLVPGDAFVTARLEADLRRFVAFISASLDATEPRRQVVLRYALDMPLAGASLGSERSTATHSGHRLPSISIQFLGTSVSVSSQEVLAAPTTSKAFEERLSADIPRLKVAIKEVTLGGHISA